MITIGILFKREYEGFQCITKHHIVRKEIHEEDLRMFDGGKNVFVRSFFN